MQCVVIKGFTAIHTRATHGMNSTLHCEQRFVKISLINVEKWNQLSVCKLGSSATNVSCCSINWYIFHPMWVITECINNIWSFVKCSNTSIAPSVCTMQLILFCDLLSGDFWEFYRVCSNDKHWGHILPFIELAFKLFSTSAYIGEIFFALEEKLFFSVFKKNSVLLTNCRSHFVCGYLFQNTRFLHPYKGFAHFIFPI